MLLEALRHGCLQAYDFRARAPLRSDNRRRMERRADRDRPRPVFVAFAAGFALAAAFHVAAIVAPGIDVPSPAWRHGLFVGINLAAAAGMIFRPRGFAIAFAILTAQQVYSHGTTLVTAWQHESRIDWPSVVVLVAMPSALVLLARSRLPSRA
jgi:hypothetical protein